MVSSRFIVKKANNKIEQKHKMTSKIRKVVLGFTMFVLAINFTAGCVAMIQNAVVDAFPTFEATENSWPVLSPNMGRVVIYWPREGLGSDISVRLTIFGQKSAMSSIGNHSKHNDLL